MLDTPCLDVSTTKQDLTIPIVIRRSVIRRSDRQTVDMPVTGLSRHISLRAFCALSNDRDSYQFQHDLKERYRSQSGEHNFFVLFDGMVLNCRPRTWLSSILDMPFTRLHSRQASHIDEHDAVPHDILNLITRPPSTRLGIGQYELVPRRPWLVTVLNTRGRLRTTFLGPSRALIEEWRLIHTPEGHSSISSPARAQSCCDRGVVEAKALGTGPY